MVYITGDLHGDIDRLKTPQVKALKKGDTLIVLGDFGFLWAGGKNEEKALKWLGKRKYNLLFIEGTHDNYDMLSAYPVVEYAGGKARSISGKLHQLLRGEVFEIEGKTIFCFGGGVSEDIENRTEGETWWLAERPTEQEKEYALQVLENHGNQVDFMCTHEGPDKLVRFLDFDIDDPNEVSVFLGTMIDKVVYNKWFFAAVHKDKSLGPKATAVYRNVIPLG